jgi:PAS domain S-box-containing protein
MAPAPSLIPLSSLEAEEVLLALGRAFGPGGPPDDARERQQPSEDDRYRTLVEQLPAIVFMAFLDEGTGKAYVSPFIEATLGFSQAEWLEDPVRWYQQIHPEDKTRWSGEAARLLLTGDPLRSVYRVLSRQGQVVWFHCEAKIVHRDDGRPWFIHGVAFDITELKLAETALDEERQFVNAVLDTVGALVVVLDRQGRIVRFNRACEETTGFSFEEVRHQRIWDVFPDPDRAQSRTLFGEMLAGGAPASHEARWPTREGRHRLIAWSHTVLHDAAGARAYVIATGLDVTDRRQLEAAVLDISEREQVRIGQDLHDGLGQHLTGVALMSKVLHQKLASSPMPGAAADAAQVAQLVTQAIAMARELSHGLLAGHVASHGLTAALRALATEVRDVWNLACRFTCDDTDHPDVSVSTHLFRIAQEAVSNALHHGRADEILIDLALGQCPATLTISDNGVGFPADGGGARSGMGLRIMRHRATMIGGSLGIERTSRQTVVTCTFAADFVGDGDESTRLRR